MVNSISISKLKIKMVHTNILVDDWGNKNCPIDRNKVILYSYDMGNFLLAFKPYLRRVSGFLLFNFEILSRPHSYM